MSLSVVLKIFSPSYTFTQQLNILFCWHYQKTAKNCSGSSTMNSEKHVEKDFIALLQPAGLIRRSQAQVAGYRSRIIYNIIYVNWL